jgi:hypothetical protein
MANMEARLNLTGQKLDDIAIHTNSMKDALVKAASVAGILQGEKNIRDRNENRQDVDSQSCHELEQAIRDEIDSKFKK